MDACDAAIAAIVALPAGERTFANTMLALEDATDEVSLASGAYAFMAHVAPDSALRDAARARGLRKLPLDAQAPPQERRTHLLPGELAPAETEALRRR